MPRAKRLARVLFRRGALAAVALIALGLPQARAQDALPSGDAVWPYLAGLGKAQRMAVLEPQAKKEGRITVYGGMAVDRGQIMVQIFHDAYPDIPVDYVRIATNEIPQRLMLEFRAGRSNADFVLDGLDFLGLMSPALAPYQATTWDDYDPRFRHGSPKEGWTAMEYDSLVEAIAWRTDRISSADAPKTLDAVADPKWKGRTGAISALEHDVDNYIILYGPDEGLKKLTQLAALENRIYPSVAGLAEGLSTGEIDLAWGVSAQRAYQLKAAGAPVDFVYSSPSFTSNEFMAVAKGAKHPYAAALMMEVLTGVPAQEKGDKLEPGRAHGNTKGQYGLALSSLQNLMIAAPLPPDKYREDNRIVQRLFIRRQ